MLVTVLLMALAVSVEPFRIGMTVLMLNRPRPALQLLAFLGGGFAMGMTVGLVVLFVFRHALTESPHFTLPNVQILIGVLALVAAAIVVIHGRRKLQPNRLTGATQRLLSGPSLLVAGIAGLGIALPSVDYLAALAVILASGAEASTQVAVAVDVQCRGLRAGGDTVAGLRPRTAGHAEVGGVAAQLDSIAAPCRRRDRAGRGGLRVPRGWGGWTLR